MFNDIAPFNLSVEQLLDDYKHLNTYKIININTNNASYLRKIMKNMIDGISNHCIVDFTTIYIFMCLEGNFDQVKTYRQKEYIKHFSFFISHGSAINEVFYIFT